MSDALSIAPSRFQSKVGHAAWGLVVAGLLALYIPTYVSLANGVWNSEENAHGPIVLIVALYLLWRARGLLFNPEGAGGDFALAGQQSISAENVRRPVVGWAMLVFGLLLYALGRSQDILLFEVGSQIPVLIGTLLIVLGGYAVRVLWFPLFFLLFMVPLPGFIVDGATGPLKQHVSELVEHVLYAIGYPIARNGVALSIGPYQLLVADACSGLNSMFSLSAMGLLYVYLMQRTSLTRKIILIASILPTAFIANVLRVMVLVLITYYFGEEAGQGFIHKAAGVLLFIFGVLMLYALDSALGPIFPDKSAKPAAGSAPGV